MEINVTVTKEQIRDYILTWKQDEILAFVKEIDEWLEDWEFTVKLWYQLDRLVNKYKDEFIQELIDDLKGKDNES